MKERADKDKLFSNKDEELKKLEGRLHHANSDKSSLQAKLAAAEKDLQATKKSNELLKNKVNCFTALLFSYLSQPIAAILIIKKIAVECNLNSSEGSRKRKLDG